MKRTQPAERKNDPNANYAMYEQDRIAKREAQSVTGARNAVRRYIFTNHVDGKVGDFHHIIASSPMLAIRQLIAKHGKAPYKILAITEV